MSALFSVRLISVALTKWSTSINDEHPSLQRRGLLINLLVQIWFLLWTHPHVEINSTFPPSFSFSYSIFFSCIPSFFPPCVNSSLIHTLKSSFFSFVVPFFYYFYFPFSRHSFIYFFYSFLLVLYYTSLSSFFFCLILTSFLLSPFLSPDHHASL